MKKTLFLASFLLLLGAGCGPTDNYLAQPAFQQTEEDLSSSLEEDFASAGSWKKVKCTATKRWDCSSDGCASGGQLSIWVVLDRESGIYSRCDSKGCDDYPAQFATSGMFVNVQGKNPMGGLVKVQGDRVYIEQTTVGLSSINYSGTCIQVL